MSELTKETLQTLKKDQLIEEVIKYYGAYAGLVTKYNTDVQTLNDSIAAKDGEIKNLQEEINTKNLKLKDINQMIKPTTDTIIQTYFIKAYENRIGTEQYGGEQFNLATAVVKLVENTLSWKVTIHRNNFVEAGEHSSSRELTGVEMNVIKQIGLEKGWYVAFKSFLSIPVEFIPETFGDTLLFT